MPTYEYECDACKHQFEEYQSITADALTKCPKCGRKKLRRLLGTGGGIIFKGSGFYQTDYRSESYKSGAESEKKSASGGDTAKSGGDSTSSSAETKKSDSKTKPKSDSAPKGDGKSKTDK